jgi:hypothetical protein
MNDGDNLRFHPDDVERFCRSVLHEIKEYDDDQIVPGHWGEADEPLTAREIRERFRAALTRFVVERQLRGSRE